MTTSARIDDASLGPVLITGANGFIGTHATRFFSGIGNSVVALTRGQPAPAGRGITNRVIRDLDDRPGLASALSGVQTVIHVAARVHAKKEGVESPDSACHRINVEGTRLLLEESVKAGVRRFLFISSVKAVASESDTIVDEDTTPMPTDAYGASKLEAERLVRVTAVQEGLHAPILRLPLVYGTGMKSNMARLFQAVEQGIPLPLGDVRNRRSFVYVDNVMEGMRSVLTTPAAASETFFISDGIDLSTPDLVRSIAASFGRRARLFPVPVGLMRSAANLLSRIGPIHLTLDSVSALVGSLFVDTAKIKKMTGYTPAVSIDEGLARTARRE
ncbi:MAG TPA: NAD-dependent epimerase/dehydratase family protein [Gemmatimonadaceae bacterium]|nr:NAD-dependent epimerase/dehydratase family protein [Gemmatimonadaceae bacterium]